MNKLLFLLLCAVVLLAQPLLSHSANPNGGVAAENVGLYSLTTTFASGVSTQVLARNPNRDYLSITNASATVSIYVKPGSAHTGYEGVIIAASGTWAPSPAWVDAIYIKAATATASATMIEGIR